MTKNDVFIILASQSPRRRELLAEAGYQFTVTPPDEGAEGTALAEETPSALVLRNAREKGRNVAFRTLRDSKSALPSEEGEKKTGESKRRRVVLACDTIAVCGGEILGKPIDRADARRMLEKLSGSEHEVLSGLFLQAEPRRGVDEPEHLTLTRTTLFMEKLSNEKITDYLNSGLWSGKAGAFGYQDGNDWIHILDGSASNVVGLPLETLARELETIDFDADW